MDGYLGVACPTLFSDGVLNVSVDIEFVAGSGNSN
jgi:hypothetical protein